ncbi:MAG: hypothetical protein WCW31_03590 [Patescibacteria group bacterium]
MLKQLYKSLKKKSLLPMLVLGGVVAAVVIYCMQPLMYRYAEAKLNTGTVSESIVGNLTPARDLRGTWKSSLSGKGVQVTGKFITGPATTIVTENGDMELVITSVKNNIAYGKMRFTNLCATAQVSIPNLKTFSTKQCTKDTGYRAVTIRVSSSHLDFGTVTISGAKSTMQGNFTTDIMSGTMTTTLTGYGTLNGKFNLNRKR